MSNLLEEVLQSSCEVQIKNVKKLLPELKLKVDNLENDLNNSVENVYIKYCQRKVPYHDLLESAKFQQTLTELQTRTEFLLNRELESAQQDLDDNITKIRAIGFKTATILNIINILKLSDTFNTELEKGRYENCVQYMKELEVMIQDICSENHLSIIDKLKISISDKKLILTSKLSNIFKINVNFINSSDNITTKLQFRKPNDEMQSAISAYYASTDHLILIQNLAKDLWEFLFVPIVTKDVHIKEFEENTFAIIELEIKSENQCDYTIIFSHIIKVLTFLKNNFNYNTNDDGHNTLELIGTDIRDNLSELIIKKCLRNTIPSNEEELKKYEKVKEDTKKLEEVLLDANIFTSETESILKYANNVDIHFINKRCEEYLKKANEIMKKDLHDIIEIEIDSNRDREMDSQQFSQCSISKNVKELLDFCENLLEQALSAAPQCSGRLFVTVKKIVETYKIFVPNFHKNYLSTLPQHIAIFFNNCKYIGYRLIQWDAEYCTKLRHELDTCDFFQEISTFPYVGLQIFQSYVDNQRKQIDEIMEEALMNNNTVTIDKVDPKTEKCVRQCLRQQELLRTVWQKVLSQEIYHYNIGVIVDSLCRNIIIAIVNFEDISTTAAAELVDIIKIVVTRAPKLFNNSNEITVHVPLWCKLNELIFVLNSNLLDINERWADGKGPLALHFEPKELKQLIKALFQNTDRRAAVLARIK